MRYTLTPAQMRAAERRLCDGLGLPEAVLMERAAEHIAAAAQRLMDGRRGRVLVLCGTGGNGGDGLAAARLLAAAGTAVTVWLLGGERNPLCELQYQWLQRCGGEPTIRPAGRASRAGEWPADTIVVVDALFGTGLTRAPEGTAAALIAQINALTGVPVLAADVPSGLDAETGAIYGDAVRATETVCFHAYKTGLLLGEGPGCTGRVTVCDIGLPAEAPPDGAWLALEPEDFARLLPRRSRATHKGSYGRLLVLAGSEGMAGAAELCASAALKTGVGLCTVACPASLVPLVQQSVPSATCIALPLEDPRAAWAMLEPVLAKADALACGCGLGQSKPVWMLLMQVFAYLQAHELPAVLDADALNVLAQLQNADTDAPYRLGRQVVLTPHPMEAARLLGRAAVKELPAPEECLRLLGERYGASVVLKGAHSLMASGEGRAVNLRGTAAMAKGGSGDALTGVLGALLAGNKTYRLDMLSLLQAGCYLHGAAGELAARLSGERGLLATGLIESLGQVDARPSCAEALGELVTVTVDRPLGSAHPRRPDIVYAVNYGYVYGIRGGDGAWQDAYVLGVENEPLDHFTGQVVAVIERLDDIESKWVVAPRGSRPTEAEIREQTVFVEQYFQSVVHLL